VPLRKIVLRYVAMLLGHAPIFAVLLVAAFSGGDPDALASGGLLTWLVPAAVVAGIWSLVLIVQVALKRDPLYDRWAGTAAVRGLPGRPLPAAQVFD
jgi:hypothetical protein